MTHRETHIIFDMFPEPLARLQCWFRRLWLDREPALALEHKEPANGSTGHVSAGSCTVLPSPTLDVFCLTGSISRFRTYEAWRATARLFFNDGMRCVGMSSKIRTPFGLNFCCEVNRFKRRPRFGPVNEVRPCPFLLNART